MTLPKLYSAKQISDLWPVSESWCYDHLPSFRIGGRRFFREDEVLKRLAELEGREDNVVRIREVAG